MKTYFGKESPSEKLTSENPSKKSEKQNSTPIDCRLRELAQQKAHLAYAVVFTVCDIQWIGAVPRDALRRVKLSCREVAVFQARHTTPDDVVDLTVGGAQEYAVIPRVWYSQVGICEQHLLLCYRRPLEQTGDHKSRRTSYLQSSTDKSFCVDISKCR